MENEFEGLSTDRLCDVYGEWLAANGFDFSLPLAELIDAHGHEMTNRQREWLADFETAYKAAEAHEDAIAIERRELCDKWAKRLGLAWHPDTRGAEMDFMPEREQAEYDSDMDRLFSISPDPYDDSLAAWRRAGLIGKE